jgi:hypothetical protein
LNGVRHRSKSVTLACVESQESPRGFTAIFSHVQLSHLRHFSHCLAQKKRDIYPQDGFQTHLNQLVRRFKSRCLLVNALARRRILTFGLTRPRPGRPFTRTVSCRLRTLEAVQVYQHHIPLDDPCALSKVNAYITNALLPCVSGSYADVESEMSHR